MLVVVYRPFIETIPINISIHFLLKKLILMTTCVVHPILKDYSVESARTGLVFHLLEVLIASTVQVCPVVGLIYFAAAYLPNTIIFAIIILFAISVVSGPVNSLIFFGQITSSQLLGICFTLEAHLSHLNRSSSVKNIVSVLYDIWNLIFFHTFIPPFCLTNRLTRLQEHALEYMLAFYPLLLIVLLYVCMSCWKPFLKYFIRFRSRLEPKTSIIDVFATFTLLSYVKLLFVTIKVLLPTILYNDQGKKVKPLVLAYSTSTQYSHEEHLPVALLSIFISLTFVAVPPFVLMFYPTSLFQKCLTRCKINCQALRTFVETFQGCYKDGTNGTRDYRYFAGFYFTLRVIVAILTFGKFQLLWSSLLYWFTALLFALVQPYKRTIYNVIDAVIFGLMGTIYFLITRNTEYTLHTGHQSSSLLVLTDALYTLPLVYLVLFIVCWVLNRKLVVVRK